jgi:hypothetical protein
VSDWHRTRVEAAAHALAREPGGADDLRRAARALQAADAAVYGIVPREDYELLALDYSAMKVRAHQSEELIARALEALDRIAAESAEAKPRGVAFACATEVRVLLAARADADGPDDGRG